MINQKIKTLKFRISMRPNTTLWSNQMLEKQVNLPQCKIIYKIRLLFQLLSWLERILPLVFESNSYSVNRIVYKADWKFLGRIEWTPERTSSGLSIQVSLWLELLVVRKWKVLAPLLVQAGIILSNVNSSLAREE